MTAEAIRAAAIRLFHRQGFEATTMRQLATEVGIEAASLYNHIGSKQELLAEILLGSMRDLLATLDRKLSQVGSDPVARLVAAVRTYVLFHDGNLEGPSISDTERRSLEPEHCRELLALREQLSKLFRRILADGVLAGVFKVDDQSLAVLSVLSICARLPVWYRPGGRLELDQIATLIARNCLRMLGCDEGQIESVPIGSVGGGR